MSYNNINIKFLNSNLNVQIKFNINNKNIIQIKELIYLDFK